MAVEEVDCNLCGSNHTKKIIEKDGFCVVECLNCHLRYVNPRLTAETLADMYNNDEISPSTYFKENIEQDKATFRRQIKYLKKFKETGTLLDVGCNIGTFLTLAKEAGYQVKGIEISERAAEEARRNSVDVKTGTLLELHETFDIIVMNDLLEHVPNPKATITKAAELLNKNGILMIVTPNAASLTPMLARSHWPHYKMKEHIYYFSPNTINKLCTMVGLKIVSIKHVGRMRNIGTIVEKSQLGSKTLHKVLKTITPKALHKISIPFNMFDEMTVVARK